MLVHVYKYLYRYKYIPQEKCYNAFRQESHVATLQWAEIAQLEPYLPVCFGEK